MSEHVVWESPVEGNCRGRSTLAFHLRGSGCSGLVAEICRSQESTGSSPGVTSSTATMRSRSGSSSSSSPPSVPPRTIAVSVTWKSVPPYSALSPSATTIACE
ncbi:hypothetical protein ASF06_18850 [Agreia sp. Leaf244]|nr:hypothetical protein ASF06_18850 [Agreia sp. Leaf244]